ncbi:OmpP1/FadL family transporter [Sphingobacterium yanglingense]|uniref:Outer membrane protein transport protein (OMPP1/FadL/TodX) n=1 Tax=Sphingobacterium yanglingense TaxID=1437280 RepID=A0A4R6WG30_9SPHI|nr:hypothetical protein [Sphingobacterium yanglingense]TDQ77107.1 hypothetical protein CLV99_2502 [Sphingobacterium yanglingense]
MKFKHIILSAFVSSIFWSQSHAQSVDDALTFSREDNGGSARMKGMGNPQTALGGDISAINGNPAGLGFFSRSDMSITFDYLGNKNKTSYQGMNSNSKKDNFGVDQAGVVFHFPSSNYRSNSGWLNFNVGISYNKTQNFNNRLTYEGVNNQTTIVNALSDLMANDRVGDFRNDFANSNIVEQFGDSKKGYFPLAKEAADKNQYNDIITRGNRSKTAIAFGSNYDNKFYIGATLGITSFRYEKSAQFIENGWTKSRDEILADNPNSDYADPTKPGYKYTEASYELFDNTGQVAEGSGVDFKLGMIYKPTTDWNIGLTINTPTWMTVKDDSQAYTDVHFYDNDSAKDPFHVYESKNYPGQEDYNMTTPWKFGLGLSKFFSRGLLTADMEYVTYNTMRYSSANYSGGGNYDGINKDIKDLYKNAVNFRVGGEFLFTNILSGRAGFNYFGNPYKGGIDDTNYSGSLGLGIKLTNSLYMDLAVVHQVNSYKQAAYAIAEDFWKAPSPVASIDHKRTSGILTLGAKF